MHTTTQEVPQEQPTQVTPDVPSPDVITPETKKARKPRAPRKKKVPEETGVHAIESADGTTVIKIKLGNSKKVSKNSSESLGTPVEGIAKPKRKQASLNRWQQFVKENKTKENTLDQLGEAYRTKYNLPKKEKKVKPEKATA